MSESTLYLLLAILFITNMYTLWRLDMHSRLFDRVIQNMDIMSKIFNNIAQAAENAKNEIEKNQKK